MTRHVLFPPYIGTSRPATRSLMVGVYSRKAECPFFLFSEHGNSPRVSSQEGHHNMKCSSTIESTPMAMPRKSANHTR